MLLRNMRYTLRTRFFLVLLLIASFIVIDGVVFTASSTIASQMQFFSRRSLCRYTAYAYEQICANAVELPELSGTRFQVYLVSTADERSGAVAVGVCSPTGWASRDGCDLYIGDERAYLSLPSQSGAAYVSSQFYDLYEHIDPWIQSVSIADRSFEVAGMADFYLSDEGLGLVYSASNQRGISASVPPIIDSYGNEADYPDSIGTIMISGADFRALNLPVAYVEIAFESPPARAEYDRLRAAFPEDAFYLDSYRAASGGFNLSYVDLAVCLIGVGLAIALVTGVARYLLDANHAVWRAMYLIGCTRGRLWRSMMFQMGAFCLTAAILAAPLSWVLIQKLAAIGIAISISPVQMLMLALIGCAADLTALGLTCRRAVRAYTREEGAYVSEH